MMREGGGRKHCFVNVYSLVLLYLSVDEGLWVGAESLILGQVKSHLFPAGFLYSTALIFTNKRHGLQKL